MSEAATRNRVGYEDDLAAWAEEQGRRLRAGDLAAIDVENIAEEIEALGRSQMRELQSRLIVLLQHLLKWKFQPEHQCRSWSLTIRTQRRDLLAVIKDSPSLRRRIPELLAESFSDARDRALEETGLYRMVEDCPWTVDQILSPEFLPGEGLATRDVG